MENKSFEMKNYGKKPTFASFLPGISGVRGIPIWCFYVNRGQGVVSFGIENKDKAIMEFYPAHEAYRTVKTTGFRTFIKKDGVVTESFRDENVPHSMNIYKNSLELTEDNSVTGVKTEVTYFTLPEERVGALMRMLTVTNTSDKAADVEILDGMPALIPYGVNEDDMKTMNQTIKAWMQVKRTKENIPFFCVRASTEDSATVSEVTGGNFAIGTLEDGTPLPTVIDADAIFGYDNSLGRAVVFEEKGLDGVLATEQMYQNQLPCCFHGVKKTLAAGESVSIYQMIGQVENQALLSEFVTAKFDKAYYEAKRNRADALTEEVGVFMDTKTANPVFDEYCRYNFLDNVLRGGLPIQLGDNKVFYVYSRKHGDLERDYNFFAMLPEFYSQGNGNFRDVNQNRRCDDFFAPFVGDFNIKSFYSLLQPDGGNPLGVEKITYRLMEDGKPYDFTPGSLYNRLMADTSLSDAERNAKFEQMINDAEPLVNGRFIEGYWSDHWTYNLDLIENFLQIFPEKEEELLFTDGYTWFRPQAGVLKRTDRYVKTAKGVRQYKSVEEEGFEAKEGCENALLLCDDFGKGKVIRASLMEKLVALNLMKFANLDPYGMGIEMEGGKPGWYDALNGLPGIFGSAVTELCELARNLKYTVEAVKKYNKPVSMLAEMADYFVKMAEIAEENEAEALAAGESMNFWNAINDAKEFYRKTIYAGVSGERKELSAEVVAKALAQWSKIVDCGVEKAAATQNGICPAYFYYEVTEYEEDANGINPVHFAQKDMPLFLEGAVRYMKLPHAADVKESLYTKVKGSDLYDNKLSMYKVNASLENATIEIGRCKAFTPGWLENESIWLHMEYKYLLELIKSGLYEEYFADLQKAAIPFLDPAVYGRSVYENSSFIASSANPDVRTHGRGFVARLSGSTAEFIQMWTLMMFGKNPFTCVDGKLALQLQPILPDYLIPEDGVVEAMFLGKTRVFYNFASKKNYVPGQYAVKSVKLTYKDGTVCDVEGGIVEGDAAVAVRDGQVAKIELTIE